MEIIKQSYPIYDLTLGYVDKGNEGVEGLGGNLDIRPPYQREFVYTQKKQQAVIDSVNNGFPLGIIYWVDTSTNDSEHYEVLDGQQRIISICKYVAGDFSIPLGEDNSPHYFHNLTKDEKDLINSYELDVYICKGTEREKLEWFERINVQGEPLTNQELRNASYTGPWLSDAKTYFSKNGAPVDSFSEYLTGSRNRQNYLETAIEWKSADDYGKSDITRYMAEHQNDDDARELWLYFFRVMNWVQQLFPNYRREMKGVEWGLLYNDYKDLLNELDPAELEVQVKTLMMDDEVKAKKGIYSYLFDSDEKHLNLRTFTPAQKRKAYEEQSGICNNLECPHRHEGENGEPKHWEINEMEADHITPWSKGGKTDLDNLQLLCRDCNRRKSSI